MLRSAVKDRRGVGVAEYALLLFIVLVVAAVSYKVIAGRVKHAGTKTEEQFATQGASSGGSGGQNGQNGNGPNGNNGAAGNDNSGAQGGGGSGAQGGGGGGGGGGKVSNGQGDNGALEQAEEADARGVPLWKIIGGVFVLLFAIGGYFAFRKQKSSG